ncbi:MAG: radical SAM protein [Candidatus Omnitrophota bacterium]|nr:MAG: radical SAM protein [Candidatus Omnitrophota bacterium]
MYFYGPVLSRRLGFSLGIDLFSKKTCNFSCIYCQLGKTPKKRIRRISQINWTEFKKELRNILKKNLKIDCFTLSGSGEPTLHKNLDKIISLIKKETKNKYPICVITNSSLLYKKEIRKELRKAEIIIPSLDAASFNLFKKINNPHPQIKLSKVIEGLINLRREFKGKIYLEIMLIKGLNDGLKEIEKLKKIIEKINPDKVHLNLPIRPTPEKVNLPSQNKLEKIKKIIGDKAFLVTPSLKAKQYKDSLKIKEKILEFLKRRPANLEELSICLGENSSLISKHLSMLLKEKRIRKRFHKGKLNFLIND